MRRRLLNEATGISLCMDQMMISLNGHPEAAVGDPVLLFGRQDDDFLPVWKVAEWAETIAYEVLCTVGTMNPRVYLRSANPGGKPAPDAVEYLLSITQRIT